MNEARPHHHGPITRDCPVECLQSALSRRAWSPLARGDSFFSAPPKSVGDVLEIQAEDKLQFIRGLGRGYLGEIETALRDLFGDPPPRGHLRSAHEAVDEGSTEEDGQTDRQGKPDTRCPVCGTPAGLPPREEDPEQFPLPRRVEEGSTTARALAWMAANCHRNTVQVADIAEAVGLGTRALEAAFQKDLGRGPVRMMTDMRLHRVHLALSGQGPALASLDEAAVAAGYRKTGRFSAAYRDRYGREPALPATGRDMTRIALPPLAGPDEESDRR